MSTQTLSRADDRRASRRRTLGLARTNALLLVRNRLTLVYALVLPLLPMAVLLSAGGSPDREAGTALVVSVLSLAWLFPVYYTLLSMVVTRREELVLKRLRTGETRDAELLTSLALPGTAVAVAVAVLTVVVGVAGGLTAPQDPVLYAVTVLLGCALFTAFALWTAAWTRTAEAAQMTSLPVVLLGVVGIVVGEASGLVGTLVALTPGAALGTLAETAWFGPDGPGGLAEGWAAGVPSLAVVLAWTLGAGLLARRSMRWEPRT